MYFLGKATKIFLRFSKSKRSDKQEELSRLSDNLDLSRSLSAYLENIPHETHFATAELSLDLQPVHPARSTPGSEPPLTP